MKSPERLHGRFLRFPDNTLLTVHMVCYLLYYMMPLIKKINYNPLVDQNPQIFSVLCRPDQISRFTVRNSKK